MATNNAYQAQSAKEELLELLEKQPKIFQDAVKYTFACRMGIRASSYFDDKYFSGWTALLRLKNFKRVVLSGSKMILKAPLRL